MNSKFLKICEQVKLALNEQDNNSSLGSSVPSEPSMEGQPSLTPSMTTPNAEPTTPASDEESKLPVASNKEIISALKSIKNFYRQKKQLNQSDVERLQMLSDDESDENVKKIIKTLNNIFNPVDTIDTNPKNVPNSDFER